MGPLSGQQLGQFVADGFVRLEGAFDRALIEPCISVLNDALHHEGVDINDERTWRPVVRLLHFDDPPFFAAANSTRLKAAWDQLVGAGRWFPRPGLGTFPIRFPSHEDPGDAGWHIDDSYQVDGEWRSNVHSRNRALLMLFLLSDVGEADAPTRIRVGSHVDVSRALVNFGEEGTNHEAFLPDLLPRLEDRPVALATGDAGDVYLCHPFLVHAAGWPHRGTRPRYVAQPPLALREPLDPDAEPVTPLERSVAMALTDR